MSKKDRIIKCVNELLNNDLIMGSWGNVSIREKTKIFITPTMIPYKKLKRDDVSELHIKKDKLISGLTPSSEYLMHKYIYKKNSDIKAIIHTHSEYLTLFSILREKIPPITEEQIVSVGPEISYVQYYPSGTKELAEKVSEYFKKYKGVMLANHGFVGTGEDIEDALLNCRVAEKTARIFYKIKPYFENKMKLDSKQIYNVLKKGD